MLFANDFDGYYVISNLSGILIYTLKSTVDEWENTVKLGKENFKVKIKRLKVSYRILWNICMK